MSRKSHRILARALAVLIAALLLAGCGMLQQVRHALNPPLMIRAVGIVPDASFYGTTCQPDQPQAATITAQVEGRPHRVVLRWRYGIPHQIAGPWHSMSMTPTAGGWYEAVIQHDPAALETLLAGQDGNLVYEVTAMRRRQTALGGGSVTIAVCAEP